jgi:hypothetical protein
MPIGRQKPLAEKQKSCRSDVELTKAGVWGLFSEERIGNLVIVMAVDSAIA